MITIKIERIPQEDQKINGGRSVAAEINHNEEFEVLFMDTNLFDLMGRVAQEVRSIATDKGL
jgi:hypothetical protein